MSDSRSGASFGWAHQTLIPFVTDYLYPVDLGVLQLAAKNEQNVLVLKGGAVLSGFGSSLLAALPELGQESQD